jgi:metal transporter CNNM
MLAQLISQLLGGHDGGGGVPLTPGQWWTLAGVCAALVVFAGVASGLTLGLMSLDAVDMEVGGD